MLHERAAASIHIVRAQVGLKLKPRPQVRALSAHEASYYLRASISFVSSTLKVACHISRGRIHACVADRRSAVSRWAHGTMAAPAR